MKILTLPQDRRDLVCPACEVGQLEPSSYSDTLKYCESDLVVDGLECYRCPECGADPIFEDQIERNHARVVAARRRADIAMSMQVLSQRYEIKKFLAEFSHLVEGYSGSVSQQAINQMIQQLRTVDHNRIQLEDINKIVAPFQPMIAIPDCECCGSQVDAVVGIPIEYLGDQVYLCQHCLVSAITHLQSQGLHQ